MPLQGPFLNLELSSVAFQPATNRAGVKFEQNIVLFSGHQYGKQGRF